MTVCQLLRHVYDYVITCYDPGCQVKSIQSEKLTHFYLSQTTIFQRRAFDLTVRPNDVLLRMSLARQRRHDIAYQV